MTNHLHKVSELDKRFAVWKRHLYVLPIYLISALLFTYPTMFNMTHVIGGKLNDALENYWNIWWTYEAVGRLHQNPFYASSMQYPFGLPLYFHTYNIFNGLISLPLQACCGTTVAYNVLNIGTFVFAAGSAYALVWYLTHRRASAMIAGLIYGFSPYMSFHFYAGQPFMMMVGWLALYVLALLKGLREHPRWLWLAAIFLAILGFTDWHIVVFALTATGILVAHDLVRTRTLRAAWTLAGKIAFVGTVFAVLTSPVTIPMITEVRATSFAERPLWHSLSHSADLLSFILPSPFHPVWGEWASSIFFGRLVAPGTVGGMASLGFVALGLAIYGSLVEWRRSALFIAIFVAASTLALGPYLQVNGINSSTTAQPVPLPYLLFRQLPFMDVLRIPSRFVALAMLGLAALAGIGVAAILERSRSMLHTRSARSGVATLIALLILLEYWPRPLGMTEVGPAAVSPFYQQLGTDSNDYALVEIPYREQRSLFFQMYHRKRTVGGRISRQKLHPWIDARFFGPLIIGRPPKPALGDTSGQAWRAALGCMDVRYAIFYKQDYSNKQQNEFNEIKEKLLEGSQPVYEDNVLSAYGPFQPEAGKPFWTPESNDWHAVETPPDGATSWLKEERGSVIVYRCGPAGSQVQLTADVFAFAQARSVEIRLDGNLVHQQQLPPDQPVKLSIPLTLREGQNVIEFGSPGPAVSPASQGPSDDTRMLRIGIRNLSIGS